MTFRSGRRGRVSVARRKKAPKSSQDQAVPGEIATKTIGGRIKDHLCTTFSGRPTGRRITTGR